MGKKLLCLIVAAVLVLSMLPMGAMAEAAHGAIVEESPNTYTAKAQEDGQSHDNIITLIEIFDLDMPYVDEYPDREVSVPEGAHYSVDEVSWSIFSFAPFESGREYCAGIRLVAEEGYLFSADTAATINGSAELRDESFAGMDDQYSSTIVIKTVDFPAEELVMINTIEILGFDEPVWGGHFDFELSVPEGAHYSIQQIDWNDGAVDENSVFDDESRTYYADVVLTADYGYRFSWDAAVTVNGGTWLYRYITHGNGGKHFLVQMIGFGRYLINHVDLLDFDTPILGAHPDYDIGVPNDAPYSIQTMLWGTQVDREVDENYVFEDATLQHAAGFRLVADSGYRFSDYVHVTINGGTELVGDTYTEPNDMYFVFETVWLYPVDPAAVYDVEILDLDPPAWGEHPDFDVSVPEGALYSVSGVNWYSKNADDEDTPLTADDVFNDESLRYYAVIYLEAAEGYTFSPHVVGTVNGGTEYIIDFNAQDGIGSFFMGYYTVSVPKIQTVEILDLDLPAWGAHPDYEMSVPDGAPYAIPAAMVSWTAVNNELGEELELAAEDVFNLEGWGYGFVALIPVEEGYDFAENCTVTVNGSDAYVWHVEHVNYAYGALLVGIGFFTVEPPDPINEVEILDFDIPAWGEHPDFDVSVPDGALYSVSSVNWYSKTADDEDTPLTADDVFNDESLRYYAVIYFETAEGYVFSSDAVGTVNGGTEYIIDFNAPDSSGSFLMGFFTVSAPGIETVEILDFDIPAWGNHPDFDVSVPEGVPYSVSSVNWYSKTADDEDTPLTEDDVFNDESLRYYAVIYFETAEGYVFSSDAVGTVNGGTEYIIDFNAPDSSGSFLMGFFTVSAPAIETVEILDFDIPAWGEHPDFDVSVPDGAPYSISDVTWVAVIDETGANILIGMVDVFDVAEWKYGTTIIISPDEGYAFAEDCTVTVNGSDAYVISVERLGGSDAILINIGLFAVEEPAEPPVVWGDADGDGVLTIEDGLIIMRYLIKADPIDEENLELCDVSGDGSIDLVDALLVMRKATGIIEAFPVDT